MQGLSSALIDLTTDFASPVLVHFDVPERDLQLLQDVFRHEVKSLGPDVRGLVDDSVDGYLADLLLELHRAGGNPVKTANLLYSVSLGPAKQNDAWLEHWSETAGLIAPPAPAEAAEWATLVSKHLGKPLAFARDFEQQFEDAWMRGPRSAWDDVAYELVYRDLGVPPAPSFALANRCVRQLADAAVRSLPPASVASLNDQARAKWGAGRGPAGIIPGLDAIAKQTTEDERLIAGQIGALTGKR